MGNTRPTIRAERRQCCGPSLQSRHGSARIAARQSLWSAWDPFQPSAGPRADVPRFRSGHMVRAIARQRLVQSDLLV